MDSKYYFDGSFYGLKKLPSTMSKNLPKSFLKQSEKLALYGLRKLLFSIAQKPCNWCLPRVRARYLYRNYLTPYAV